MADLQMFSTWLRIKKRDSTCKNNWKVDVVLLMSVDAYFWSGHVFCLFTAPLSLSLWYDTTRVWSHHLPVLGSLGHWAGFIFDCIHLVWPLVFFSQCLPVCVCGLSYCAGCHSLWLRALQLSLDEDWTCSALWPWREEKIISCCSSAQPQQEETLSRMLQE